MAEILVVGALHLDVIVRAARLPGRDETLMGEAVRYAFGGKGGNQAVAAARLGAKVAMAGRVGDDGFAVTILAALDAAGIDRRQVRTGPGASGMSVAILDATGDYGAVVVSGVNNEIAPDEIEIAPETRVLLLQNEIPTAVNLALAARLRDSARLILNAAPAREMPAALLVRTDCLVVNRVEAAMMTGVAPDALDPDAAARALRDLGPEAVIVTLGGGGLAGHDAGGAFHAPAFDVAVSSTHGAGDTFTGALAARLAAGDPLRAAARFAQGAAALQVSGRDVTGDAVLSLIARP